MQITPELIDHTEFHNGVWLQNALNPGWYYFSKRKNPNIISRSSFIYSVDKQLQDAVKFLHANGIRTTPSCAGHLYNRKKIAKLYESIHAEANEIRSKGIYLKDVQTDRLFYLCNKDYQLPWSKEEFSDKLEKYQAKGIMGVRLHPKLDAEAILKQSPAQVNTYMRDNILFFLCENGCNDDSWKKITRLLKANVKR